jgi:PAS domain S-box-containing protein
VGGTDKRQVDSHDKRLSPPGLAPRSRASGLLGREPLAYWPEALFTLAMCGTVLLLLLFADVLTPQRATFGSLGLVPVVVAAFLLRGRWVVVVVAAAVLFRALGVSMNAVDLLTAAAQSITYVFVACVAYLAANAIRTSRRSALHAERLRTVIEAATNLAEASLSPRDLVEQMMTYSARTAAADRGTLSRIEGDEMVVEASYDPSGQPLEVGSRWKVAGQPLVVDLLKSKGPVQGRPANVSDLPPELAERIGRVRHILAVPLFLEGGIRGLLSLSRFREPAFSEDEIDSVQRVARIAALALRGSRLYADGERARREAETAAREMRASEGRLAEAQRIAHLGSWEWDIPGDRVTWSEEMYRIYGRNRADGPMAYEDFLSAVHPDDREFVGRVIGDSFGSGTPYEFEHRIVRPDGTVRTLQAFGQVVIDDSSNKAVLMAGTGQDITERKLAEKTLLELTREREDQLREHAKRMEDLEKLKTEFLLIGSHELRGPLTILSGYISLMQDGVLGDLPEKARGALPTMAAKTVAMKTLINEMLQSARLEQGVTVELKRLDLREVALDAVDSVAPLVGSEQRLVTQVITEALPVMGDRERLSIILTSLIDNAIKYSGPQGEIAVSVSAQDGSALVSVRDGGIGIGPADMARLFTRFGRIITADNAHIPGTGLGLYLARSLADLHGGQITVESEPGKGSTFTVRLPVAPSTSAD